MSPCLLTILLLAASPAEGPEELRLVNNPALSPDGSTLAFAWGGDLSDAPHLASLARELAANDPQRRTVNHGPRDGRNVELLVRRPAWMA